MLRSQERLQKINSDTQKGRKERKIPDETLEAVQIAETIDTEENIAVKVEVEETLPPPLKPRPR